MKKRKLLIFIGTRPEAIKLIPIIKVLYRTGFFDYEICLTGQHLSIENEFFKDTPYQVTYQLKPPSRESPIAEKAATILQESNRLISATKPDCVIVQGDTTTACMAALAAFYSKVKIAHVEAGLRTRDIQSPWPEEAHRVFIDKLSDFYFAPSLIAKNNLIKEGVDEGKIWVVGNTSIDAIKVIPKRSMEVKTNKQVVITLHRRESFGVPFNQICKAIQKLSTDFLDVSFKYYSHLNPRVLKMADQALAGYANIEILPSQSHQAFVDIMRASLFIITDSGGVQEEATFLGKPVVITRDVTEREEVIAVGNGVLAGRETENIIHHCQNLLNSEKLLTQMSTHHEPYGRGTAADEIINILKKNL